MIFCSNLSRQLWPTMPKRTCRRAGDSGRFRDLSPTSRRKNMMTGGFLSHRGTKPVIIHLYIDGFSHGNRHHSAIFWGTPMAMETSMTGNGSKVKTPQGQIGLNSTIQLLGYPIPQWPFQEPIHWRYRFRIFQANFQADFFQYAEYSHNMARNLVPYGTHTPCAHHEEHRAAGHGEPPARRAASAQRSAAGDAGVAIEIDS